ncbi:MAG: tetratricopeptide repeat protein, partial [Acidobacteriota bacterium]|nr:tetratricopeptide repeat protein [Acidobacteriota bacterium]
MDKTQAASMIFVADEAEAYRLTGQLDKAQALLAPGATMGQRVAPVLNALGNLSLDRATIALDKEDANEAKKQLTQAQEYYRSASQAPSTLSASGRRSGPVESLQTIETNLGEAYINGGRISQQLGQLAEARNLYEKAAQSLNSIQQLNSQYPFVLTDLGQAYQGLGNVAALETRADEARAAYAKAENQYRQAVAFHPDMAEAYFNLGDLFEDEGNREAAKENYERAIKARPEQWAAYYPLALLLQKEDPQRAAALAATYLQLLPAAFQQGENARNADLIQKHVLVTPPKRPNDDQAKSADAVVVPNVVRMTRDEAIKALTAAGLSAGRIQGGPQSS